MPYVNNNNNNEYDNDGHQKKIYRNKKGSNSLFVPIDSPPHSPSESFIENKERIEEEEKEEEEEEEEEEKQSSLCKGKKDAKKVSKITPKKKSNKSIAEMKRSIKDKEIKEGAKALMGLIKKEKIVNTKTKGKKEGGKKGGGRKPNAAKKKTNLSESPTPDNTTNASYRSVDYLNPSSTQQKKLSLVFSSSNNSFSSSKSSSIPDSSTRSIGRNTVFSRNWCFTIHNPDLNPPYLDTPTFWIEERLYHQLDWQYEKGKKAGSTHIQGAIRFKQTRNMEYLIKRLVPTSMKKENPNFKENRRIDTNNLQYLIDENSKTKIFWTISNHSYEKSSSYCHKTSTALQPNPLTAQEYDPSTMPKQNTNNNKSVSSLPPSSDQSFPFSGSLGSPTKQGSRTDIYEMKSFIDADSRCTIQNVAENFFSTFLRYKSSIQSYILSKSVKREWKSEVTLLYGASGTGKSRFAQYICSEDGTRPYYIKDHSKWYDNYDGYSDIIYDDFYGSSQFCQLLQLLDRYSCNVEVKCGVINFAPERIFITSNKWYLFWYINLNRKSSLPDIKIRMDSLYRRIDNILIFQSDGTVTLFKGRVPKLRSQGFKVIKNLSGRSKMEKELNPERFNIKTGQKMRLYMGNIADLDQNLNHKFVDSDTSLANAPVTFDPTFDYIYSTHSVQNMDDESFSHFSKDLDSYFMLNLLPVSSSASPHRGSYENLIRETSNHTDEEEEEEISNPKEINKRKNNHSIEFKRKEQESDGEMNSPSQIRRIVRQHTESESDSNSIEHLLSSYRQQRPVNSITSKPKSSTFTHKSSSFFSPTNLSTPSFFPTLSRTPSLLHYQDSGSLSPSFHNTYKNPNSFFSSSNQYPNNTANNNKSLKKFESLSEDEEGEGSDSEDFSLVLDLLEKKDHRSNSGKKKKKMFDDIENDDYLLYSSDDQSKEQWNDSDKEFINDNEENSEPEYYLSSSSSSSSDGYHSSTNMYPSTSTRKRSRLSSGQFSHLRLNNKLEMKEEKRFSNRQEKHEGRKKHKTMERREEEYENRFVKNKEEKKEEELTEEVIELDDNGENQEIRRITVIEIEEEEEEEEEGEEEEKESKDSYQNKRKNSPIDICSLLSIDTSNDLDDPDRVSHHTVFNISSDEEEDEEEMEQEIIITSDEEEEEKEKDKDCIFIEEVKKTKGEEKKKRLKKKSGVEKAEAEETDLFSSDDEE